MQYKKMKFEMNSL